MSEERIDDYKMLIMRLKKAWEKLTKVVDNELHLFKNDEGMDRTKEWLIDRAKRRIMTARCEIEDIMIDTRAQINVIKKRLEAEQE